MAIIDLALARSHLRDPDDDDAYLGMLLDAAEDQAMQFMDRRFYASQADLDVAVAAGEAGDRPLVINDSVRAACLLILGHLFANREDVATGITAVEIPRGSRSLLMPYRIGMGI
ncbi:head-tail connector protein [Pseudomonas delhiensis]|uniref:head-tail connector protein n=1 Tax=Pseudomonas delhiensis TaxID=366289 RepID=UPI00315ADE8F